MPRLKKIRGQIPKFKTEAEEREFWETHDTTGYVDWSKAQWVTFPNLKLSAPSTKTISLRLPERLLSEIRSEARKRDVPYQSLMKIWLSDKVAESRKR